MLEAAAVEGDPDAAVVEESIAAAEDKDEEAKKEA